METRLQKARVLVRRPAVWIVASVVVLLAGLVAAYVYHTNTVARQWEKVQQALERQDLPAADDALRGYLTHSSASAEGHFLLAQTLRREGQFDEAERERAEAQRLGWDAEAVRRETSLAWLQRQGVREKSADELRALAQGASPDRALLESLYRGDLALRNWDRAGLWLFLWLEHYPDDWAPRLWEAELLERFQKYDRARAGYLRVLDLRPDQPRALLGVGLIALDNRADYTEAETYLGRYLVHDPRHAGARLGLARCRYGRGELPTARQAAADVLADEPHNPAAALLLGTVESEAGHDEEALWWLRQAEADGADVLNVNYELALVLRRLSRTEEAEECSRRFTARREAFRDLETALRLSGREPDSADRSHAVGRAYRALGDPDQAALWFQKAVRQDPAHRPSHAALADYFAHQSDQDAAARAEFHRRQAMPDAAPEHPGR